MNALEIDDLFCLYRRDGSEVAALRGLTLTVAAGERVLVHGPSGAGKTTLMRVICGLAPPSAGRAMVLGSELHRLSPRDLARFRRSRLGLIDQGHRRALRPELSVLENVALPLELGGVSRTAGLARARDQLERLGLGELAERRPVELSGGQAQRVAACAALVHEPPVILADEPTGELDQQSADAVYDLLAEIARERGSTLLIVSHDPRAARVADRMVRIRDGRLSEERSPVDSPEEALVLDDRGWLRLPDELRRATGLGRRVQAQREGDAIVLRATAPAETALPVADVAIGARAGGRVVARLRGVSRRYGEIVVVSPLDLDVHAGELIVLFGRSGSGKTTILRMLAGLERPSEGEVEVDGRPLSGLDRAELAELRRRCLAMASQGTELVDSLDAGENVELSLRLRELDRAPGRAWLAELGLAGVAGRPARVLSGGERQRVAVARVLAAGATLALFDEPTSQLDEANAERLGDALLAAAREGTAIVCATHDPVLVARADRVIELHQTITVLHTV